MLIISASRNPRVTLNFSTPLSHSSDPVKETATGQHILGWEGRGLKKRQKKYNTCHDFILVRPCMRWNLISVSKIQSRGRKNQINDMNKQIANKNNIHQIILYTGILETKTIIYTINQTSLPQSKKNTTNLSLIDTQSSEFEIIHSITKKSLTISLPDRSKSSIERKIWRKIESVSNQRKLLGSRLEVEGQCI